MISAIILAAGMSSRMGTLKQLLHFRGRPMVRHVADAVSQSRVKETIVVVGARFDAVCAAIDGLPVRVVINNDFASGQSTSLRKGVNALAEKPLPDGVLFALADQPLLLTSTINHLINEFYKRGGIIVPRYEQQQGNPVIFARKFLPEMLLISGDEGARKLMEHQSEEVHFVDVKDRGVIFDIDTWQDYERLTDLTE